MDYIVPIIGQIPDRFCLCVGLFCCCFWFVCLRACLWKYFYLMGNPYPYFGMANAGPILKEIFSGLCFRAAIWDSVNVWQHVSPPPPPKKKKKKKKTRKKYIRWNCSHSIGKINYSHYEPPGQNVSTMSQVSLKLVSNCFKTSLFSLNLVSI